MHASDPLLSLCRSLMGPLLLLIFTACISRLTCINIEKRKAGWDDYATLLATVLLATAMPVMQLESDELIFEGSLDLVKSNPSTIPSISFAMSYPILGLYKIALLAYLLRSFPLDRGFCATVHVALGAQIALTTTCMSAFLFALFDGKASQVRGSDAAQTVNLWALLANTLACVGMLALVLSKLREIRKQSVVVMCAMLLCGTLVTFLSAVRIYVHVVSPFVESTKPQTARVALYLLEAVIGILYSSVSAMQTTWKQYLMTTSTTSKTIDQHHEVHFLELESPTRTLELSTDERLLFEMDSTPRAIEASGNSIAKPKLSEF